MNSKNNPTLKSSIIRVGLTIGDPAGIGPAITLKALRLLKGRADFTVIGDSFVLAKAARALETKPLPSGRLIDLNNVKKTNFVFGRISAPSGRSSLEYLDAAAELLRDKRIDCLVTCPVSKEAINLSGSKFSGHTEYLADKFHRRNPIMMLINDKFKFSLVTRHIPLKDVCKKITSNGLENSIIKTIRGLKYLFSIRNPKIVVCGINPHASDNGVIGDEEQKVIKPAIMALKGRCRGSVITGPLPADVAISGAARGNFDCVIALYHDQALIPLKLADFDSGINLTLGLPFVRTSPLHGTAFDLAARPSLARPNSLVAAIKLAIKCTLSQKKD
ncbi:MAG: 4-hydroxythreonine-4-phosphate dehydrogenase PdxA [Candidatus Omnitrophica bacterium]|nr:4-hydroxythreonine-4-phosphate dehydrogenase PdxA [Candidatus Omnitrophota bacterium]